MTYKLWIDDCRPAPLGYDMWINSVNQAKAYIIEFENRIENALDEWDFPPEDLWHSTIIIDIDHDAGDFAWDGGDFIKLLDWLEETGRKYPIRIHSMNPVGVENMRRIIQRNGWTEVK